MGGFPSGQRGQTVNLLQIASVVRIHLRPFVCCRKQNFQAAWFAGLQKCARWYGGIGRRKGLKIPRGQPRAGSSPATSTKKEPGISLRLSRVFVSGFLRAMRQVNFY